MAGEKPALLLVGGQHARDIATPEMLMRFAAYLTAGYGADPDATWLLDHRAVVVLPLANPDGYFHVYLLPIAVVAKNRNLHLQI